MGTFKEWLELDEAYLALAPEKVAQVLKMYNDPATRESAISNGKGLIRYVAQQTGVNHMTVRKILELNGISRIDPLGKTAQSYNIQRQWQQGDRGARLHPGINLIYSFYNDPMVRNQAEKEGVSLSQYIATKTRIPVAEVEKCLERHIISSLDTLSPSARPADQRNFMHHLTKGDKTVQKIVSLYLKPGTKKLAAQEGMSLFAYIAQVTGLGLDTIRKALGRYGFSRVDPTGKSAKQMLTQADNPMPEHPRTKDVMATAKNPRTKIVAAGRGMSVVDYIAQKIGEDRETVRNILSQKRGGHGGFKPWNTQQIKMWRTKTA